MERLQFVVVIISPSSDPVLPSSTFLDKKNGNLYYIKGLSSTTPFLTAITLRSLITPSCCCKKPPVVAATPPNASAVLLTS